MLGVGIFINTVELTKRAGAYSSLVYVIIGLMMLPLIISIATLVRLHPDGGFYTYAKKEINSFAGFLSAWGYFTGKLGSGAIVLHTAVRLIQYILPVLQNIPTLSLDAFFIGIFMWLNMLNIQAGASIQKGFMVCKIIPILFAIFVGLFLFQPEYIMAAPFDISGIGSSLSISLFAIIGFEVACSISNKIENPKINGPRAILISYGLVITTVVLYQLIFYGALGSSLAGMNSYLEAFPELLNRLFPSTPVAATILAKIIHLAFAASALGGSYGTMFSNGWNLHVLARHNHLLFSSIFTWLNKHAIPVACIAVEGLLYMSYLVASNGNQVPLQQLGALGCVLGYTFSVLSLLIAAYHKKYPHLSLWLPLFGLINCIILIIACVQGMLVSGPTALYLLIMLLFIGTCMYLIQAKRAQQPNFNEV